MTHLRPALLFTGTLVFCSAVWAQPPAPATQAPPARRSNLPESPAFPPLSAPLGRIGDVVSAAPKGGLPVGGEFLVVAQLPGCDAPRAFHVERFLTQGAVGAAEQVHAWLGQNPAARQRLFGKGRDPLAESIARGRSGRYLEGRACPKQPALSKDGKTGGLAAPRSICKPDRAAGVVPEEGITWITSDSDSDSDSHSASASGRDGAYRQRDFASLVHLSPAADGAKDGCRPRMSATLYDDRAQARVRYHADWSGTAEVEVLGDRCRRLRFRYDAAQRQFLPAWDQTPGCPKP